MSVCVLTSADPGAISVVEEGKAWRHGRAGRRGEVLGRGRAGSRLNLRPVPPRCQRSGRHGEDGLGRGEPGARGRSVVYPATPVCQTGPQRVAVADAHLAAEVGAEVQEADAAPLVLAARPPFPGLLLLRRPGLAEGCADLLGQGGAPGEVLPPHRGQGGRHSGHRGRVDHGRRRGDGLLRP